MNERTKQLFLGALIILLAVFLLNPLNFWMPGSIAMVALIGLILAFGFYATFVVREKADDERELMVRAFSGRIAFLSGSAIVLVGILSQSLDHNMDPWLVVALTAMISSKILANLYIDRNL